MAETIEGGVYLSTDGVTYHDANGKPVPAPTATVTNRVEWPTPAIVVPPLPQRPIAPVAKPKV